MERSVALIVPGLCGPAPGAPLADLPSRRPPALERLLSRAHLDAAPLDSNETLCSFFDLDGPAGGSLPVAPLTWLADTGQRPPGYVLRADPVHLRADRACLRLYDCATFAIDAAEAAALVATFNDFYREQGWRLVAPLPQRWYLFPSGIPEITTVAPGRIAGEDIDGCLPAGRDASDWHALLNEIQMLFHSHPVNAAREAQGAVAVNSLWPWGGGILPERVIPRVSQLWTDQPLGAGLARLASIPWQSLPAAGAAGLRGALLPGVNLILLDVLENCARHAGIEAWGQGIMRLEQDWFGPLLELLKDGYLTALEIYPVTGERFGVNRRDLLRFWKRIRPLVRSCRRG